LEVVAVPLHPLTVRGVAEVQGGTGHLAICPYLERYRLMSVRAGNHLHQQQVLTVKIRRLRIYHQPMGGEGVWDLRMPVHLGRMEHPGDQAEGEEEQVQATFKVLGAQEISGDTHRLKGMPARMAPVQTIQVGVVQIPLDHLPILGEMEYIIPSPEHHYYILKGGDQLPHHAQIPETVV